MAKPLSHPRYLSYGACPSHTDSLLLWVAIFLVAGRAVAATFTASLSPDTITLGESATLSLTFSGGTPLSIPSPPEIPGLQIDYVGQSTQISILNGETTSTVTHNFNVSARQPGEFVIPSLGAEIRGEKLASSAVKLKVLKPGAPPPEAINSGSQLAFIKLVLPKQEMFVGESTALELDLYLHGNVQGVRNFTITGFPADGCNIGGMVERSHRRVTMGGTVYNLIPLSFPLKVLKAGNLTIGPVTVSVTLQLPTARRRRDPFLDPFEVFGGGLEQKQAALATESQSFRSLDLPRENVPAGFNGAVGSYSMSFSAGPTNVAAGDPITLRVQISGRGNLDSLNLPDQPAWHEFKAYPPTAKVDTSGDPLGIEGTKTFEQVLVPQNPEIKELPSVTFSFFNPEQKAYRTVTQPAVRLIVRPGGSAPPPTVANASRAASRENPPPTADIIPIKTRLGLVAQAAPVLVERPWFLALQSVPVLAWLSALVLRRRAENLANNPRLRRQRQVAQTIHNGLNDLRRLAAENHSEEFFATFFRLLQEQLGERLDLPASSVTEAVIDEQLRPRKVADSLLGQLHELFQLCNLARYAPIKSSQELAAIVPKLEFALQHVQQLKL